MHKLSWVPFTTKSPPRMSKRHCMPPVVIATSPILRRKNRSPRHGLFRSITHPSTKPARPSFYFCDFGVTEWHVVNCPLPLSQKAHTKGANIFQTQHEALFFVFGQMSDHCIQPCLSIPQPIPHPSSHVHLWKNKYGAFCKLHPPKTCY